MGAELDFWVAVHVMCKVSAVRHLGCAQEAVELRLGQGMGAVVLERVLGGYDEKGRRQGMGDAVDAAPAAGCAVQSMI